ILSPTGHLVAIHDDAVSPRPSAVASEIAGIIDQLHQAGEVSDTDISVRLVSVNERLTDAIFERVTQAGAAHYVHVDRDGDAVMAFRFTEHATPTYTVDRFNAQVADGRDAPALLFRPREIVEGTPLMLTLHGGPQAHDMAVANLYQQTALRRGSPVLAVNYRGSTGHGLAHERAGDMQFDSGMLDDISAAIAESFERLGGPRPLLITGGSFGGHLSFASAREWPAETCAVIVKAPAADLAAFQERAWSYVGDATNAYWAALYGRWYDAEDAQRLIAASAVTRPDNWDIPVAVITGAEDRITPLDQVSRLAEAYEDVLFSPFEPIEGAGHDLRPHKLAPVFDDAVQQALSGPCAF
ncbi:MAG: prolyl oligopeptidase family serine peptidase, partial [Kangiellaceae bacterium]|nr:prolyl oligopeptidase family serine peptidase [Kangiellaceae bacterium]